MKVKITVTQTVDTEDQDKYLKDALERLAWNKEISCDKLLVLRTFSSRADTEHLKVELL